MRLNKTSFWIVTGIFLTCLFWITKNDPFFGDAISSISRASNHIYNTHFSAISYPENLDPGHPITYPLIHASVWTLTGRNLWGSHLFHLLFSLGTLWVFVKWARKEGHGHTAYLGGVLLLISPLFVSQTINPNMHLPLTFFSLGLAYSLKYNRKAGQITYSLLLVIIHLQGLYFLAPIWLWWFFSKSEQGSGEKIIHGIKMLLLPGLAFVGWVAYHYYTTGWALSSPDYAGHRGFPGIKRFIVNLILADWRMVDYGQLAFFILPTIALIGGKAKWKWNDAIVLFLIVYTFNAFALAATTKTGPMHRYILPCLPFIVLANLTYLKEIKTGQQLALIALLISGHFWFYPGKIMGDATVSYRSIFPLLDEAKSEFGDVTFYTYAPLSNPSQQSKLCCSESDYQALYNIEDINSVPYVIVSNISGDFKSSELNDLHKNWKVKTYEKGYVYLEVYSNPAMVDQPLTGPVRKIGWFEQWLIKLKHKIKGKDGV